MGLWSNWKQKREERKCEIANNVEECLTKIGQKIRHTKRSRNDFSKTLEENDKARFQKIIVENIDVELARTQQHLDDLIEDPHIHSQGFISPKQGIHALVEDIVENANLINLNSRKKFNHEKKKALKSLQTSKLSHSPLKN